MLFKGDQWTYYKQLFLTKVEAFAILIRKTLYEPNIKQLMIMLMSLLDSKINIKNLNDEYYYRYKF